MLSPQSMSGRTVGILGLGLSGMAAARALGAAGAELWLHDDTIPVAQSKDGSPDGATLAPWQDWPWQQLDSMVISPGIPHAFPVPHPAAERAAAAGVEIISEIEVAIRAKPAARLVVVTGTNGKSTTTALLGHCLDHAGIRNAVGGNIGDAACNLDDPGPDGVIVLEMSSYQLETTYSLQSDIAIILNITPDHLDRHNGMDGYIAAKARALTSMTPGGLAVLGNGGDHLASLARNAVKAGTNVKIVGSADAPEAIADAAALSGAHNAENAAAAAATLRHLGVSETAISTGMASFAGLPHRMQQVAQTGGIVFINDSKATNGVAAAKALAAFDNIYWIAGGDAKEDGIRNIGGAIGAVRRAYLIGTSAASFAASLSGRCPTEISGDLESATVSAFSDASAACADDKGNSHNTGIAATILLSPAAASFDQFDNFVARGNVFTDIAHRLTASDRDRRGQHA